MATGDKRITVDMLRYFKTKQDGINDSKFVAIEQNKALISSTDQSKLDGIAAGAQVNVIETINVNSIPLVPSEKVVNIDLSEYAKLTDIATVYRFKGSVNTYADLPRYENEELTSAVTVGDVYNVTTADSTNNINAGDNVVCSAIDTTNHTVAWDNLSGIVDLSAYATTSYVTTTLQNYVLSTTLATTLEDYVLTADLNKIVDGDNEDLVNYPGLVNKTYLSSNYTTSADLATNYVAKESGKGLSNNNFTDAYKNYLDISDASKQDILMEVFGKTEQEALDIIEAEG